MTNEEKKRVRGILEHFYVNKRAEVTALNVEIKALDQALAEIEKMWVKRAK